MVMHGKILDKGLQYPKTPVLGVIHRWRVRYSESGLAVYGQGKKSAMGWAWRPYPYADNSRLKVQWDHRYSLEEIPGIR